jgi:ferredoxin-nitrite reductase
MNSSIYSKKWARQSKLNRFELIKLTTDGLDILDRLRDFQKNGFNSMSEEEKDLLKWAGAYLQRPRTDGYLMMRVKIPCGILTSAQARIIADVSREYGRDILDITTRQAIQFHWLTVEDLPDIHEKLSTVGLSTIEACGDCPRNIIGNPLAGIDPHEILDTRDLQDELFNYFQGNREFSNLPRKFKISISANIFDTGHAAINDLAFTPACKTIDGEQVKGFHLYVGGGLSARPKLAKKLDVFVLPKEVLNVTIGVVTLFRDYGYRENRQHARLKFLIEDWGAEKFKVELEKLVGPLRPKGDDLLQGWNAGYFNGIHSQKQTGLKYVGLSVPLGRLNAKDMEEFATLADTYGDGFIRTTNSQNVILSGIPDEKIKSLLQEPLLRNFSPYPDLICAHTISCTGKEFCNLAIVETKKHAKQIIHYLDTVLNLETPIRIHVTGCPNSCGQLQIADIGLRGTVSKLDGQTVEGFELQMGGMLGPNARFATKLNGFIPAKSVPKVLEHLLLYFKDNKTKGESFNDFFLRVGFEVFQERLDIFLNKQSSRIVRVG